MAHDGRLLDPVSVLIAASAAAAALLLGLPVIQVAAVPLLVLAVRVTAGHFLAPSTAHAVLTAPTAGAVAAPARAGLSRRELQVAPLIAEGLTNKEIAVRLFIEESTVDSHVDHIKNKLGFIHKTQIAAWWAQTEGGQSRSLPESPSQ